MDGYKNAIPAIAVGQIEDPITLRIVAQDPDSKFVVMPDGRTLTRKGHRLFNAETLKKWLNTTHPPSSPSTRLPFEVTSVCSIRNRDGTYLNLKLF